MVNLGDLVKDSVSGFKGIAVSRHSYLQGCDRISIQPPIDKNGKHPESVTFDEPQLIIIKKEKIKIGQKITGGVDKYMDEGR
jgi:ribosomal protein L14